MVCQDCGRVACDTIKMLEKVVQAHNMFVNGMNRLEKSDVKGETLWQTSAVLTITIRSVFTLYMYSIDFLIHL
jgi:hypothetical protein